MARYDLRLAEQEIGRLTLKEYDALLQRKKAEDNYARLNAGIVAAAVYNSAPFGDANRKPINALDFVPDWKQPDDHDLTGMTPEQQKVFLMNMFYKRRP